MYSERLLSKIFVCIPFKEDFFPLIFSYLAALKPEVGGGTDLALIIISSSVESYPLELSLVIPELPPAPLGAKTRGKPNFKYVYMLLPNSDLGPYLGLLKIDCTV